MYNMVQPQMFLAIIETPQSVWTLTNDADGAVLFTCSVRESATATSQISYLDAVCVASKLAYDQNRVKALTLLGKYLNNRPKSNSNNKIGNKKLKSTCDSCSNQTYTGNGVSFGYALCSTSGGQCVSCTNGEESGECCNNIYDVNMTPCGEGDTDSCGYMPC